MDVTERRRSIERAEGVHDPRSGVRRVGAALARTNLRPRKSRGQNFLVQEGVAQRIVEALQVAAGDQVIEVGPGLGILALNAARRPLSRLTLVEIDGRLAAELRQVFHQDARVTVLNADFLELDLAPIADGGSLKVVGNLPFNVATAILERLSGQHRLIQRMVLMFQREVAERIRAQPGMRNHCALSVLTALDWRITEHFRVAAGSFYPRPTVDAEVLVFEPHPDRPFGAEEETLLRRTIHAGFSAPRRTIRNCLVGGLMIAPEAADAAIAAARIEPSMRPAMLNVAEFVRLARALREQGVFDRDA